MDEQCGVGCNDRVTLPFSPALYCTVVFAFYEDPRIAPFFSEGTGFILYPIPPSASLCNVGYSLHALLNSLVALLAVFSRHSYFPNRNFQMCSPQNQNYQEGKPSLKSKSKMSAGHKEEKEPPSTVFVVCRRVVAGQGKVSFTAVPFGERMSLFVEVQGGIT